MFCQIRLSSSKVKVPHAASLRTTIIFFFLLYRLIWKLYNKRDGLCTSKDELEFREKAGQISALANESLGEEYWDDLKVKLWKHVVVPKIVCPQMPVTWKNNCCESLVSQIP